MRIGSMDELFDELDRVVATSRRGDLTRPDAADFWTGVLTREGHPLNSRLPDEPLVDWSERGLLGSLDGARVLDVGCGNGRNGVWLASRGADVMGVDLAAPLLDAVRPQLPESMTVTALDVLRDPMPPGPFDLVYDSGCFHHLAPHRRITYRERVLPLLAPGGRYAIVAFSQERQPSPADREIITSGDQGGGMSFLLEDLERIFAPMRPVDLRPVRSDAPGTFGAAFLNAGLFQA